jgi:hypothetical protein
MVTLVTHSATSAPVAATTGPLREQARQRRLLVVRAAQSVPTEGSTDCGAEPTPQEVWWALEDLWLRLAARNLIAIENNNGWTIVMRRMRDAPNEADELRALVLDVQTYQSYVAGRRHSFVRTLAFRGEDLVCEFQDFNVIARWPEGEGLVWQVRGFLARLTALGCASARQGGVERSST